MVTSSINTLYQTEIFPNDVIVRMYSDTTHLFFVLKDGPTFILFANGTYGYLDFVYDHVRNMHMIAKSGSLANVEQDFFDLISENVFHFSTAHGRQRKRI